MNSFKIRIKFQDMNINHAIYNKLTILIFQKQIIFPLSHKTFHRNEQIPRVLQKLSIPPPSFQFVIRGLLGQFPRGRKIIFPRNAFEMDFVRACSLANNGDFDVLAFMR